MSSSATARQPWHGSLPSPSAPSLAAAASSSSATLYACLGFARAAGGRLLALAAALVSGLVWAARHVVAALVWLLTGVYALAAGPVGWLAGLVRFLFSPVTYTLSYALAPVGALFRLLGRLRPLYTYLGSAAFVGIVTGLVLTYAASYLVPALRLDSDDDPPRAPARTRPSPAADRRRGPPLQSRSQPRPRPPLASQAASGCRDAGAPDDDVWQWLEEFNPRHPARSAAAAGDGNSSDGAAPPRKPSLRPASGLLSLTIMEESSSE